MDEPPENHPFIVRILFDDIRQLATTLPLILGGMCTDKIRADASMWNQSSSRIQCPPSPWKTLALRSQACSSRSLVAGFQDHNQQGSLKEMAPANNAFSLQVTNELMQKLAKENIVAKRPARKAPAPKPSVKPLEAPLVTKQDLPLPFYPGFLSGVPGINKEQAYQQTQEQKHDLVPIYKVLEETENLNEKLQMRENSELEKVKQLAQELQDRQFRAPSYPIPCQAEKERCLQCYRGSPESPVECAEAVRMYKVCSQRVQQDFAERVVTSPR